MKLYLMRHAQAASASDDLKRPLTQYGRQEVQSVLSRLPSSAQNIAHIIHSDALRTTQTAKIVADELSVANVTSASFLRESADIDMCLSDIAVWEEDTLLVSHYPFLNQLINRLVGDVDNESLSVQFTTATMVCLEKTSQTSWVVSWVIAPQ